MACLVFMDLQMSADRWGSVCRRQAATGQSIARNSGRYLRNLESCCVSQGQTAQTARGGLRLASGFVRAIAYGLVG